MRLFIAIELPEEIRARLQDASERGRASAPRARWGRAEGIHLTLAFLGETDEAKVPALAEVLILAAGAVPAFRLGVRGAGTFGSPRAPRVLWVGLTGALLTLTQLHAALWEGLVRIGYEAEHRPFRPHLTLARAKELRGDRALLGASEVLADFDAGSFEVRELILFRSELGPGGSRYTALATAPLIGPSSESMPIPLD